MALSIPNCENSDIFECVSLYYDLFEDIESKWSAKYSPIIDDYTYSLPLFATSFYLIIVLLYNRFVTPSKKSSGALIKYILAGWNLFLSILSTIIAYKTIPTLYDYVNEHGFDMFICLPDRSLFTGKQYFWIWIFCLSKYFEYIDTFFLMIKRRKLIFLHWYHHSTVLLYVWISFVLLPGGSGYIFGSMNAVVHSIMYFYYFLTSIGISLPISQFITIIQLTQMVIGVVVGTIWTYYYYIGHLCDCSAPTFYIIITYLLYGSYFYLFSQFFYNRFFRKPDPSDSETPNKSKSKKKKKTKKYKKT
eukprot:TRINITY_DN839_c4_g1_i1.p1 TRINITY_DN839_c4_g1~~TRINITY_DN839_c4_g1_i1.p1  ORF type:complete len:304 (-),score=36.70 TRINITY_DN839_c4_g1_i1:87-998(-)